MVTLTHIEVIVYAIGAAVVGAALYSRFRPVTRRRDDGPRDQQRQPAACGMGPAAEQVQLLETLKTDITAAINKANGGAS